MVLMQVPPCCQIRMLQVFVIDTAGERIQAKEALITCHIHREERRGLDYLIQIQFGLGPFKLFQLMCIA